MLGLLMKRLRDFLALVKIGIVGSNTMAAFAGFALGLASLRSPLAWARALLVLGGTALLVGGACAVNNWMDRDLDAHMERTRNRPTARGDLTAAQTLGLGFLLMCSGLALLAAAGAVAALLGLAGAFVYIVAYTGWAKRRGTVSLYVGSVAGALPPLIGWAGANPRLGLPAWLLFALLVTWQQAHVRALGLMRAGEYRAAGIPMAGLPAGGGRPEPGGPRPEPLRLRPRIVVLAWVVLSLPLAPLALFSAGLRPAGVPLVVASSSLALGAAWAVSGLIGLASPSWPRKMFAFSLAFLLLVFCGLVVAGA